MRAVLAVVEYLFAGKVVELETYFGSGKYRAPVVSDVVAVNGVWHGV